MILGLFFTKGISLEIWIKKGIFKRETTIYNRLISEHFFKKIFWVTYSHKDKVLAKRLKEKGQISKEIEIIAIPKHLDFKLGHSLYSIICPIIHFKRLKTATLFKTNQMNGAWTGIIGKTLLKKPLILRTGYILSQLESVINTEKKIKNYIIKLIEKWCYKKANIAVVSSVHNKKYLINTHNIPEKKIKILPTFIDLDLFKCHQKTQRNQALLYVGRLEKEKNLFSLIRASAKSNLTLTIYGSGSLLAPLKQLANDLNTKVEFMGVAENTKLPHIFNRFQYYILPSFTEGTPKTLLEAMACGCICIGTNVVGINEIIQHKQNGFLAETTHTDSIYNAITDAVHWKNKQSIQKRAVNSIHTTYSLSKYLEEEKKLINRLCRRQ